MSLWNKITTYLSDTQNLRKVILIFIGIIFLGGVVLFNSDIQKLLHQPWPSRAEGDGSELDWTTDTASLSMGRSNAKMIDVVDSSGTRWLYAIGGINKVLDDLDRPDWCPGPWCIPQSDYRINLMKDVERIKLNEVGAIDENDGGWHTVASMNFGHAEFGLIEYDGYIYVISGDIHMPKIEEDEQDDFSPLLYSTIERLAIDDSEINEGGIQSFIEHDPPDGYVTVVTDGSHDLFNDDLITILQTENYNGRYKVTNVTPTTFDISASWIEGSETDTGRWVEHQWEIRSLLSGVNFYPEVTVFQDKIHIVGGVFGNPFRSGQYNRGGGYSGKDPLVIEDDLRDWDDFDLGNRPVIGPPIILPKSGGEDPGQGLGTESVGEGVLIQQVPPLDPWDSPWWDPHRLDSIWHDLSYVFSQLLLNGEFYTTVSEHYVIGLDGYWTGELGMDYQATEPLLEWDPDTDDNPWAFSNLDLIYQRVFKIGHIRIFLTASPWYSQARNFPIIMPAPQGRYGHKLIIHNYDDNLSKEDDLLVVGGASWSNPLYCPTIDPDAAYYTAANTFWVIDEVNHLSASIPNPFELFDEITNYRYIGNITYKWKTDLLDPLVWYGTNTNTASFNPHFLPQLGGSYAFKEPEGGIRRGRAFFGMARLDLSGGDNMFGKSAFVATGGLQNDGDILTSPEAGWVHQPIIVINRVEALTSPFFGWEQYKDTDWVEDEPDMSYNLFSVGIDNYRSVSFDGQIKFQEWSGVWEPNAHVPTYKFIGEGLSSKVTRMFDNANWFSMPSDAPEDSAMYNYPYSAVHDVRILKDDGTIVVHIYKAGGASGTEALWDWLPIVKSSVQVLGPFFYGGPGEVDDGFSEFTVEPQEVAGDGTAYAIATVTLRDYYNDPIEGKHVLPFDNRDLGLGDKKIRVEPFGTAEDGIGDPPNDPPFTTTDSYLRTSSEGTAQFKLFYDGDIEDLVYVTQIYMAYYPDDPTSNPPVSEGSLDPEPLSYIKDGVPFDTYSTITAEPYKVAVDGISTSTITLTLKDGNNLPVPGYRVNISSSRNDQNIIDTIVPDPAYEDPENPGEYITDVNGETIFYISSSAKGVAKVRGAYEHQGLPDTWIDLTSFALVEFAGYIEGIYPSEGIQGVPLAWMKIMGAETEWGADLTTVDFIQPDNLSFYKPLAGGGVGDIEEVRVVADGHSATAIGIRAIGYEDKDVAINIIDGDGILRYGINQGTEVTVTLNDEGKALFEYVAGITPGIVKIGAVVEGGGPWADLWLIQDQATTNPYHLEIYADPLTLTPTDQTSVIGVRIYRWVNGEKFDIEEAGTSFNFVVDDIESGGSMSPENVDTDNNGIARSTYNKSTEPGKAHVFVSATYQDLYIAEKIILSKIPVLVASLIHPDSTVIDSNELITLGGDLSSDPEGSEFVHIALDAKVGIWTVRVTTVIGTSSPGFDNMPMVEEHPFMVLPAGYSSGPELDIEPRQGLRGTDQMTVTIYGEDTLFFDGATEIAFVPPGTLGQDKLEILATRIFGPELAEVDIKIYHDAPVGFWTVVAITDLGGGQSQTAQTPLDKRFLVTDDNNYIVNVYSNQAELPRDGKAQATITVFVGELDPLNGFVSGLGNVDVTMSIDDDGTILPVELTTNADGYAFTVYTVDTGDENEEVTISATAEPEDGIFQQGHRVLSKVVYPYHNFTLSADPKELSLKGIQTSELTAAGLPAGDTAGNSIPVTFHFANNCRGNIEPSSTSTTTGIATSTYIAAPEESRIPEVVEIYARAVVPDYGPITSNVAAIQIGLDPDKYNLTLFANPEDVLAGGDKRSTVTAKLTYQYSPVVDWPINFEIIQPGTGDYLTELRVRTGLTSGEAETKFVPGNSAGMVYVRAQPLGLNLVKEVIINKQIDPNVDPDLSTISAVPRYVPTSEDGEDFSVVTVTLRNVNYVPLPGLQVTLTTDRIADVVTLADGTPGHVDYTDYRGRAIFHVSSTQTGLSAVTGTLVDGFELGTEIIFETPGSLIWNNLNVRVPFQARDYDNEVWIYFTENGLDDPVFVNEVYLKNPNSYPEATRNLVQELYDIKIYLHPNTTYTMWAKGRYHKARIATPLISGATNGNDLPATFDELLIGDLLPNESKLYNRPSPYHDNFVNTIDLPLIYNSWFKNSYLADFFRDFMVNSIDFNYWVSNYGPGVIGGPPPLYDK